MDLMNPAAERSVLAGIIKGGSDAFLDVDDIIKTEFFYQESSKAIWKCIKHIFEKNINAKIDTSTIISTAHEIGIGDLFGDKAQVTYLRSVSGLDVSPENVREEARKITKLAIARQMCEKLDKAKADLYQVTGKETVGHILQIPESHLSELQSCLDSEAEKTELIGDGSSEWLENILSNPTDAIGISTGLGFYDTAIGGGIRRKTVQLICARAKALRYGSKVYTINGPINIEDTLIGDEIYHPVDGLVKIKAIYDFKNKDIYRVHFRDGDFVDCCEDHLWEVSKRYPVSKTMDEKKKLKNVKELIGDLRVGKNQEKGQYKWDIKLCKSIEYQNLIVPLDPYILGLLIGDGSLHNSITFTCHNDDVESIEYIKNTIGSQYDIKIDMHKGNCKSYRINSIQPLIRTLGLFNCGAHTKFIPDIYKYNSVQTRIEVIRGLMDTDGTCFIDRRGGHCCRTTFTTVSEQLALDMKEMVQSIGGLCSLTKGNAKYKNKGMISRRPYFRCEIRIPGVNPFKLKRKSDKYKERQIGELKRTIIKIEKIAQDNARCITINRDDGLFVTDNFVITHNCGKSSVADSVCQHVAGKLKIPVLNIDTEMNKDDHRSRILANMTSIEVNKIEKGRVNQNEATKLRAAIKHIESIPYFYRCVANYSFDEILAIIKRWVIKDVGTTDGRTNDCLVVYDYFKLMGSSSLGDMQEYQALGFQLDALNAFAKKYDFPCLSFAQTNRDGVTSDSIDTIAGSDRLSWFASSVSIFKAKTSEEIAQDGIENGNRKLSVPAARYGAGIPDNDYINMNMRGEYCRITELGLQSQARNRKVEEGFQVDEDETPI